MLDLLLDGLIDTIKILPYLLITFLILEFIEHKLSEKNEKLLIDNKKYGPILGGILGALPQCGFSAMAANLFSNRVITMGTLTAVFLSTSDEMLPIMLSEQADISLILKIVAFKIIIGITIGIIVDFILKLKREDEIKKISSMCEEEHCSCEDGNILISSIKHTVKISLFILIANIAIAFSIYFIGEENLSHILLEKNILTYFSASLIGLIPNCASSVILTKAYLSNLITIGTLLSGLLPGSGLGLLLLFRTNKRLKENLFILFVIYIIGVMFGIVVDFII